MPPLPDDVTSLSEQDLMTLYSQMVSWKEYAEAQLALASFDERLADEELDARRSMAIVAGTGKTATAQKAAAADNPLVSEARSHASHCYGVRKITESVYNAAEGRMRFLSRELTRRTGIADQVRRNGRWAA